MHKKILFVVCLAVFCCASIANSAILLDRIAAIVNKEVITWSELYKAMEFEAADEIKAMKEEDRRRFFKENEMDFLDSLIDIRLKLQVADRAGIRVSPAEVDRAVEDIKKKHGMTDEMFKEAIKQEGFTLAEYRRRLAEQIIVSRLVEQEIRSKILVTEREIDKYVSENKDQLKESEGFHISHIFLRRQDDKKQVEEKAMEIYKMLKNGADFQDIASQYSEDAAARVGGNLGFVRKTHMTPEFLNVLSDMKAGDISKPFWSENGVHILRLNEVITLGDAGKLREMARQLLMNEKLNRDYKNWIKGLRERAYIEIKL
jgi:peptidyl-prolyl cis-trans isomerase SurA